MVFSSVHPAHPALPTQAEPEQLEQHTFRYSPFNGFSLRRFGTAAALLVGAGLGLLLPAAKASALEEIQLTYGSFQLQSVPLSSLETFAATGETSGTLQSLLDTVRIEPNKARAVLSSEIEIDSQLFNQAARTFVGEAFLQLVGTTFTVPETDTQSWRSLRSALVVAAADNKVSLLEVLRNLEDPAIVIDAQKVIEVAGQVRQDLRDIQAFAQSLRRE
ncbi:MAG TPA: alpha/beta hydrolase [Trichocoleus sp.]